MNLCLILGGGGREHISWQQKPTSTALSQPYGRGNQWSIPATHLIARTYLTRSPSVWSGKDKKTIPLAPPTFPPTFPPTSHLPPSPRGNIWHSRPAQTFRWEDHALAAGGPHGDYKCLRSRQNKKPSSTQWKVLVTFLHKVCSAADLKGRKTVHVSLRN